MCLVGKGRPAAVFRHGREPAAGGARAARSPSARRAGRTSIMTPPRGLRDWTGAGRRRSSPMPSPSSRQDRVDQHFDALAEHWRDLYTAQTLSGVIHQRRRDDALEWILALELPPGARILEVGCGAGLLAVDCAARGYDVDCIDTSRAMVELAAAAAKSADHAGRVTV